MGDERESSAAATAIGDERVIDLTTRSCPLCRLPMERVEYFDSEESTRARVVFNCVDCAVWEEVPEAASSGSGQPG